MTHAQARSGRPSPPPGRRASAGARLPLLVASIALAGCAASPRLLDERGVEPYAALLAATDAARQHEERVVVRPEAGPTLTLSLRTVHARHANAGPVLVLQPGVFADATTWRFLVGELAATNDLVLVDPPGCGASDKPSPCGAHEAWYTPTWLAECTLLAVRDWQRRRPAPRRLVLVGHSLGGAVVLRALADEGLRARCADVLERVEGAVLVDPADLALTTADPRLLDLRDLPDWKVDLASGLGLLRRGVDEAIHDGVVRPEKDALRQEADRLHDLLRDPTRRHAGQAMLRRFQPTDRCGCPDVAAARRLAASERSIRVPLLVLWGECDDVLPLRDAGALLERVQGERLVVLPRVSHSGHQEAAQEVARAIREFADPAALPARVAP